MIPPDRPSDLIFTECVDIEPEGPMKRHLGPRIPHDQLNLNCYCTAKDRRVKYLVRVYPIESVVGAVFHVNDDRNIDRTLSRCLHKRLRGADLPSLTISLAIVRKYLFIHTCFEAPADAATNQPMCIELFANLIRLGRRKLNEQELHELRFKRCREKVGSESELLMTPIAEGMWFRIEVATYSNMSYPGYHIPCYL
jgi:hypothetical protein